MEASPLVLAHSHANNASTETHKSNAIAASEEHDLAAGEFANAAKMTGDTEALRTLKLLEQHHQKLSEMLKVKPDNTQPSRDGSVGADSSTPNPQLYSATSLQQTALDSTIRHIPHHSPSTVQTLHRESSSSIASNLATARGIPAGNQRRGVPNPSQTSMQTSETRARNLDRRSKFGDGGITKPVSLDKEFSAGPYQSPLSPSRPRISNPDVDLSSPTRSTTSSKPPPPPPPPAVHTPDDPFSRFYATFGNFISTLSAPLAFTGLPLTSTEAAPTTSGGKVLEKSGSNKASRAVADPDLTRIFSRAALRAIREENGNLGGTESFYVVPSTGGTMSYAAMLNNRQGSSLTEEDEAEFVDASETPQPASPGKQRRREPPRNRGRALIGKDGKTWEELAVENESLKAVALDLGDRLRAFELGAQKSSLALHASMRAFSSPTNSTSGGRAPPLPGQGGLPSTKILEDKIRELEEEIKTLRKENKRLSRENQKHAGVIDRYRERWEILKVGARERVKGESPVKKTEAPES